MMTLKKISVAIAAGAVFFGTVAGSTYASSITISGNGAFSDNSVEYSSEHSTRIVQSNSSDITNNVSVSNNTGNNSSGFNTGGDTIIRTGDATSEVSIVNEGNTNIANLSNCGCHDATHISIQGNGAFSDNEVDVDKSHETVVVQQNDSDIDNNVQVNNNTGNNGSSHFQGSSFWEHPAFDMKDHFDFDKDHAKYDDNKDYMKTYDSKDFYKPDYDKDHYNFDGKKDKVKSYHDNDYFSKDGKNDHYGGYDKDNKTKSYSDKDHYYPVMKKAYYKPHYDNERFAYLMWLKNYREYQKMLFSKNYFDFDKDKFGMKLYGNHHFRTLYPFGHFGGGFNTGGDTHITTGNASSVVSIRNMGSQNILH